MRLKLIKLGVFLAIITASCSKEKECDDPIDCLPPITQIGTNKAGYIVNGKAIVPKGQGIKTGPVLFAQYSFAGEGDSVFSLGIVNRTSGGNKVLFIEVRNKKLVEGQTYDLKSEGSNSYGSYNDFHLGGFVTNKENEGELFISKIDTEKRIASGTFWFDAVDKHGEEIIKIRSGRFDVIYN